MDFAGAGFVWPLFLYELRLIVRVARAVRPSPLGSAAGPRHAQQYKAAGVTPVPTARARTSARASGAYW